MQIHSRNTIANTAEIALLSIILVFFSHWLQGDILINLADEGFLWYGAQNTAIGDLPLRDFQSYDPGRYYWTAGWTILLGNGIIALRLSIGIFQAIGLTFGLLAVRRIISSRWLLTGTGVLLLIWMIPRHKIFDHSITMAAVYFAVFLIESPTIRRHFIVGVFIGLAAFLGRNHGVYGFVSFLFLIFFILFKIERGNILQKLSAWGAGIAVGYIPMLILLTIAPDFYTSFIESIIFLFRVKSTNLPLPIPWPWIIDFSGMNMVEIVKSFSIGLFFLLLPLCYFFSVICIAFSNNKINNCKALLIASTFIGIPYMHYAFSRADINHLAQGIHPLLIGLITVSIGYCYSWKKIAGAGLLTIIVALSYFSAGISNPYYQKIVTPNDTFVKLNINGDNIWVEKNKANTIITIKKITEQNIRSNEELLIAPHWPGFYPILQRKSPLKELYFLFSESEERQVEIISELREKNVNWVILGDVALDNREELRFKNTHRILWQHFMGNFENVQVDSLPDNYQLLKRK